VNLRDKDSRQSCSELLAARAGPDWQGPPTMIFPEGRITNGERLIQFKLGAFKPGKPVLPMSLRYPFRYFNPACVGGNRGPIWSLRMMTQFANFCVVEVYQPYEPEALEVQDCGIFAQRVRGLLASELGVRTTEHTVDDAFLYRAAARARVGNDFEVQSMRRLFDADLDQLKVWLQLFQNIDGNRSGRIERREFTRALSDQGRLDDSASNIFDFFDTDGSGSIEYREFVQGIALLSGRCSAASQAKLAFLVYDVEGRGRIRRDVLRAALDNAFAKPIACPQARLPTASLPRSLVESVGERLLPRQAAGLPGASSSSHEEDIDFETFSQLADQHPEILEGALISLRRRLGDSSGDFGLA